MLQMIRQPVAADKYYSGSAAALVAQVEQCLGKPAPAPAGPCLQCNPAERRHLRGLIVPHGSMQDSGFAAAAAYRLLLDELASGGSGKRGHPRLPRPLPCVVLGTNHFTNAPTACLSSAAAWRTPLGDVAVDAQLNAALAGQGLPFDDTPHNLEHSIENQLPFLQHITGDSSHPNRHSFTIAPVCVGWLGGAAQARRLGQQVLAAMRQAQAHQPGEGPPLLIATSDFTHAGPAYREAPAAPWMSQREHCIWRDSPLLHIARMGSTEQFLAMCDAAGTSLCGRWPVAAFLSVAEAAGWEVELLSYAPSDLYVTSGNINGFASFAAWQTLHSVA